LQAAYPRQTVDVGGRAVVERAISNVMAEHGANGVERALDAARALGERVAAGQLGRSDVPWLDHFLRDGDWSGRSVAA